MSEIDWSKGTITPLANAEPDWNSGTITPPPPSPSVARRVGDVGVSLAKGIVGVPEAVVGVADLATGGRVGKALEQGVGGIGFRPKEAKAYLDTLYSPAQQAANKTVQEAKGFFPTVGAMVKNPSTIVQSAVESAPSMLVGGAAARGLLAAAPRMGAIAAGAAGEGIVAAGQNAEQVRQEDPNGTLTPQQSAILAASGVLTGGISLGAGQVANKLGIGDIQTMLASGKLGAVGEGAAAGARKGIVRKAAEGFASEGALQELPQSYQEQVGQNLAQGKPWDEGVAEAGAQGMLAGGLMGGVAGPLGGHGEGVAPAAVSAPAPVAPPADLGPASRAAAAAVDAGVQPASLGLPAPVVSVDAAGNAQTTEQRNAELEGGQVAVRRDGLRELDNRPGAPRSPLAMGGIGDVTDVVPKPPVIDPMQPLSSAVRAAVGGQVVQNPGNAIIPGVSAAAGAASAAPQQAEFPSIDAAAAFVREQRTAGSNITAAPFIRPDGTIGLALKGSPDYETALDQRQQRQAAEATSKKKAIDGASNAVPPVAGPATAGGRADTGAGMEPVLDGRDGLDLAVAGGGDRSAGAVGGAVPPASPTGAAPELVAPVAAPPAVKDSLTVAPTVTARIVTAEGGKTYPTKGEALPKAGVVPANLGKDGMVYVGKPNGLHFQVAEKHSAEARGFASTGFVTPDGRYLDRDQALAWVDANEKKVTPSENMGASLDAADYREQVPQAARRAGDEKPVTAPVSSIDEAAHQAATSPRNDLREPTEAQIEAGNYKKGHVAVHGLDVTIENPRGSTRSGKRPDGSTWSHEMSDHYGYVRGTVGADGEQVDVYVGPKPESAKVFVVDQVNADGSFDEHKAMLGFDNQLQAKRAYASNFDKGWKIGKVTTMSVDEFKAWLSRGDLTKPIAAAAAAPAPAVVAAATPAASKPKVAKAVAQARAQQETDRAAYFTPGNVVRSYSGFDRVVGYTPSADGSPWSVTVHAVRQDADGKWVDVSRDRERTHSTQPDDRQLKKGPEVKMPDPVAAPAPAVPTRQPFAVAPAVVKEPVARATGAPSTKIEDFGETLHGARKMLYSDAYRSAFDRAKELPVAAHPLSKTWPEPDYQKLLDQGMNPWAVAFAHAARDQVPTKPQSAWKLRGWAAHVEQLRNLTERALSGADAASTVRAALAGAEFATLRDGFEGNIELYEALGHANSLKGVHVRLGTYSLYKGIEYSPSKKIWSVERRGTGFGNWPTIMAEGDTREQAIERFKSTAGAALETAEKKGTTFEIYSQRGLKEAAVFIGKKIGRDVAKLKTGFDSAKEARAWKAANQAELERLLAAYKHVPSVRKPENAPRVGQDHRSNGDVSAQQFSDAFGFRGVQFGNYVEGKRRQADLNRAYDALMDLGAVVNVPPRALSLNGKLGLAFGARGTGGKDPAAAHYEPGTVVINLTKNEGAGSLAHEWWHALDNYFAKGADGKASGTGYMTEDATQGPARAEMRTAFVGIKRAIFATNMEARSKELDKRKGKAYWAVGREMSARSFESYVIAKLEDQNASNDYLANVVPQLSWVLDGGFPYPTVSELPTLRAAFDNFFSVVEHREAEDGNVPLFSRAPTVREQSERLDAVGVRSAVDQLSARWKNAPEIVVATGMDDDVVPAPVREHDAGQRAQGAEGNAKGFFYRGKVYLLADQMTSSKDVAEILFHESLGHFGLRGAFGDSLKPVLQQVAGLRRADVAAKAQEYGLDLSRERDRLIAAEEVLAEMAQAHPEAGLVKRAIAAIRTWLREHVPTFKGLALSDAEILRNYLLPARGWVQRGAAATRAGAGVRFSRGRPDDVAAASRDGYSGPRELNEPGQPDDGVASDLSGAAEPAVVPVRGDSDPVRRVARVTALGIAGRIERTGSEALVGQTVRTAEDLAALAQVYRDPRYETTRTFFLKGDIVVHATGVSSRMPSYSPLTPGGWSDEETIAWYADQMKRTAADGYYLLHNHPSGDPTPSRADLRVTEELARRVPGMKAHVVINSGKFAVIGVGADGYAMGVVNMRDFGPDGLLKASKPAAVLGTEVNSADQLAVTAKSMQKPGWITLVGTDSKGLVRVVVEAPSSILTRNPLYLAALVRRLKRNSGSSNVFATGSNSDMNARPIVAAINGGILMDAQPATGSSLRQAGVPALSNDSHVQGRFVAEEGTPYSVDGVRPLRAKAVEAFNTAFNTPGKVSWWHKTVGTPYNLAQRHPEFKRVYDSVQGFIGDISRYATEAANMAPKILPQLNDLADLAKQPISSTDSKAIAAPIFEGTLSWTRDERGQPVKLADQEERFADLTAEQKGSMLLAKRHVTEQQLKNWRNLPVASYEGAIRNAFEDKFLKAGVVWKDAELRSLFGLNDGQIALYREFRAGIDKSLAQLAMSDMVRFAGEDAEGVREMVMDAPDVHAAAVLLRDHLLEVGRAQPSRADLLRDTADKIIMNADRASELMAQGYAPLSRFGRYSVDVLDAAGDRLYFGLFESRFEADKMARQMAANYPDAKIDQGTMSEESYKLFAGVTPETLELFGEMLNLEGTGSNAASQAFQEYLKRAKTNRSAMKRLIQRKGIAGFSEDPGRVLAGFVYSNARQTSGNLHAGEIKQSTAAVSQGAGELKDAAIRLAGYVSEPKEEAAGLRGLLFTQYIGGSIASALVNFTQPLQTTFPYLSQFGGAAAAANQVRKAMVDARKKRTGDAALDKALKLAEERGDVSPQEIHYLQAQAGGSASLSAGDGTRLGDGRARAGNYLAKFQLAWGKLFGAVEQYNRRATFIAAYRTAIAQGMSNPAAFAVKAIAETQFVANKGNRPEWARGAVGATLFTFKSFGVNYVELLTRMATAGEKGSAERAAGQRAAMLAIGMLFLMGGAGGLPFAEDMEDLADALMQRLGYNWSTKQKRQELLEEVLGRAGAQFVERGVSGLPGVPLDVAGRMGMGNLIPGTGLLTVKADHSRDVAELFGPAGDLAKRAGEAAGALVDGKPADAFFGLAPKAVGNLRQGLDMATTGFYKDQAGRKVVNTDAYDAAIKAIGFQPNTVAAVQEATADVQNSIAQNRVRSSKILDLWANGIAQKDPSMIEEARRDLQRWNESNPTAPIVIKLPTVLKKAKTLLTSKEERIAATAPKAMRAEIRSSLNAELR